MQIQRFDFRTTGDTDDPSKSLLWVCVCQFGFRKWKSHVTERPIEDRSEVVKELYSELNIIKAHTGPGTDYCACVVSKVLADRQYYYY